MRRRHRGVNARRPRPEVAHQLVHAVRQLAQPLRLLITPHRALEGEAAHILIIKLIVCERAAAASESAAAVAAAAEQAIEEAPSAKEGEAASAIDAAGPMGHAPMPSLIRCPEHALKQLLCCCRTVICAELLLIRLLFRQQQALVGCTHLPELDRARLAALVFLRACG
jgi:hypothetical protein